MDANPLELLPAGNKKWRAPARPFPEFVNGKPQFIFQIDRRRLLLMLRSRAFARVSKDERLKMTEGAFLYILRCADGSYYIGITRTTLESRVAQHNAGTFEGYTKSRTPVTLVFSQ